MIDQKRILRDIDLVKDNFADFSHEYKILTTAENFIKKFSNRKRKFEIGSKEFAGVLKLQEECAELSVVLAKLVTVNAGEYWEGRDLEAELVEELGDVLAAAEYFLLNTTSKIFKGVFKRKKNKLRTFSRWHNEDQIESAWQCPIESPGCKRNCGSYGCGN